MYSTIIYEQTGSIGKITLNRPKEGNAFTSTMFQKMLSLIEKVDKDETVRSLMITGAGKHFCTGGDIKEMEKGTLIQKEVLANAGKMSGAIRRCKKPVVAVINGMAAGAGLSLALACDFRIISDQGGLLTAFINMGLSGDTGVMYFLVNMVGVAKTTEMMMLSQPVKSEEALRLGLVTKIVPADTLQEEGFAFATMLSEKPTVAIGLQKQLLNNFFSQDYEKFSELEVEVMMQSEKTEDHKEALAAFLEKRKPKLRGR